MPKVDTEGLRYIELLPEWAYSEEQKKKIARIAIEYDEVGFITDKPKPPIKRSIYAGNRPRR